VCLLLLRRFSFLPFLSVLLAVLTLLLKRSAAAFVPSPLAGSFNNLSRRIGAAAQNMVRGLPLLFPYCFMRRGSATLAPFFLRLTLYVICLLRCRVFCVFPSALSHR